MATALLEKIGLERVPQEQKTTSWLEYAIMQLSFSANTGNFLLPALAVLHGGLSPLAAFGSTFIGATLAFILVSLLTLPGSRLGLPAQYVMRLLLGTKLSRFFASPVRSITSLYWFSVQTIGGTYVIQSITEIVLGKKAPFIPIALLLAIIMSVLAVVGFHAVKNAIKLFLPLLLTGQLLMLFLLVPSYQTSVSASEGPFSWSMFMLYVGLTFVQYVSGVSASSDITRYAKSPTQGAVGVGIGNIIGFAITAVIAILCATVYQTSNPFVSLIDEATSVWIIIILGCYAVLSMVSINLSNAYTGSFSLLNIFPQIGRMTSAAVFGIIATLTSLYTPLVTEAQGIIQLFGYVIIPVSAIIVAQYSIVKRLRLTEQEVLQLTTNVPTKRISVFSLLFGAVVYILLPDSISPGFVTFIITFTFYLIGKRNELRLAEKNVVSA
ncbi:cytosine permease [Mangrovibacillus cuniculi]|uniref:Cytosine permease n=1 Tax=Mangrovibacillus cuniculi TaxID=2593652 RepID=A0A7S8CC33_9BACI|nr:cytosine permease [Mangrovibacillus cuniculi]QPC47223.1 cytosine permease [Mangrovibacillus cuniculi]